MIYTHAAAALIAGAMAFTAGWQVQSWRMGAQIATIRAEQADALAGAAAAARAQEQTRFATLQKAQDDATKRAQAARADARAARTELDRLRDALASARGGLPGESATACVQRADAAGDVLAQCAGAFTELAGQADRLNADRVMLLDAWPK